MKIDEQKEFAIYKVEMQGTKQCRKIYSDHNVIMLKQTSSAKWKQKARQKPLQQKIIKSTRNS